MTATAVPIRTAVATPPPAATPLDPRRGETDPGFETAMAHTQQSVTLARAPTTELGEIMRARGLSSARDAARIYANERLGIPDERILSILPTQPGRADGRGPAWVPIEITYVTAGPTAAQAQEMARLEGEIGQLQAQLGLEAGVVLLTVFGSSVALRGANLARYRAALDSGFKRYGAERAAELAQNGAIAAAGATAANTGRIVLNNTPGRLGEAMERYNQLFREAYGLRTVVVQ